jgi:curved DNA-binding protein CbpA
VHPDRVHQADAIDKRAAQDRYTALNAAYNCLREPKERLRHLLELERGTKPKQVEQIPNGLMDRFFEVGQHCKEADAFLVEKGAVNSPLLKVQLFERDQDLVEKLAGLQKRVQAWNEEALNELKVIDGKWDGVEDREALLARLEELYRLFSYFARWSAQIQERVVQLSF